MSGFNIEGGTALVTGANRGIGRAITEALLERGVRRVYAGARRAESLDGLVEAYGDRVVPVTLDVTDSEAIRRTAEVVGDVDLLINNAGVAAYGDSGFEDRRWLEAGRAEMEVNVFGTFELTQALAPILGRNGGGAIVNIISIAGLTMFPSFLSYSLSKAALHSLTQATRVFLGGQGTLVIGVYPGPVDTDMAAAITLDKVSPESVAGAILDGIEAGVEEIYPDPMAQQFGAAYSSAPKELERQVAAMVATEMAEATAS